MSNYELITIIISIVSIIFNLLLWLNQQKFNKISMSGDIFDAHRDMMLSVVNNEKLALLLNGEEIPSTKGEKIITEFLGIIFISHCARVYQVYKNKSHYGDFDAFSRDVRSIFSVKAIKNTWGKVKKYHSKGFIEFIDTYVDS